MIPTAEHTPEDIQTTLDAFKAVRSKLEDGTYDKMGQQLAEGAVAGILE